MQFRVAANFFLTSPVVAIAVQPDTGAPAQAT
jgi:hypothetical protein